MTSSARAAHNAHHHKWEGCSVCSGSVNTSGTDSTMMDLCKCLSAEMSEDGEYNLESTVTCDCINTPNPNASGGALQHWQRKF